MLTKEKCENALYNVKSGYRYKLPNCELNAFDYGVKVLEQLINEHFDNPPLKFEELKEGMWVWDNQYKDYVKFERHDIDDVVGKVLILSKGFDDECLSIFRENRYFRKQVE